MPGFRRSLGAAVRAFRDPDETAYLEQRARGAERDADIAETEASRHAFASADEHQRRVQAERRSADAGRMGYRVGYTNGAVDMRDRARTQARVGYSHGFGDGYETRAYQDHGAVEHGESKNQVCGTIAQLTAAVAYHDGYHDGLRPVARANVQQRGQNMGARGGRRGMSNYPGPPPRSTPGQQRQQQPRQGNNRHVNEDDPRCIQPLPSGMHYSEWHGRAETIAGSESGSRDGGNHRPRGNSNGGRRPNRPPRM